MNMKRTMQAVLGIVLILGFVIIIPDTLAACQVTDVSGANAFILSNVGTTADDLILCRYQAEPTAEIQGREGDDTILIYYDTGLTRNVVGDGVNSPGDDTIVIFEGVAVDELSGDDDTNGGTGGNDKITLYGTANTVFGDQIQDNSATDTGGDDEIDIHGTADWVIGDGIYVISSYADNGGDDVITIHEGATVNVVSGDTLPAGGSTSTGGDDTIVIKGTVQYYVYGDSMYDGVGGKDTIIVDVTGRVGISGKSNHIYGDYETSLFGRGSPDYIFIEGRVYGDIYGDYVGKFAAKDDIFIGDNGDVQGSIYGDYLTSANAVSNVGDNIVIAGIVRESVEGDGNYGNGGADTLTVDLPGVVLGNLVGDGSFKNDGDANGGIDDITVKGRVSGNVLGDGVDGDGGDDVIVVQSRNAFNPTGGTVEGKIAGDEALGNGGRDKITVTHGSVIQVGVFGDNLVRSGGNGGNDVIQIAGQVGILNTTGRVSGDKAKGNGGADFILIEQSGTVYGSVYGDDVNGTGGQDIIWIDGHVTNNVIGDLANGGNVKDQIAVRQTGLVERSVIGDGTNNNNDGGWDTINILGGTVNQDVIGDDVGGFGGNDFIAIRMGSLVGGDVIGDQSGKRGGNDTLSIINGTVQGDVIGDDTMGNGGDDKINVLVSATVQGDLIGDLTVADKTAGDDNIFVAGKVNGKIFGDHPTKNAFAGKDTIQTSPSAVIGQGIIGDNAKGAGKNDNFKINGKISAGGVRGDVVNGKGGNDVISVFSLGDVTGNVVGDDTNSAGGNDTILVDGGGKVTGNVWGDHSKGNGGNDRITIEGTVTGNVEGDRHKSGSTANGGDDIIIVEEGGLVQGNIFGDNSPGAGGDDRIDIKGKVNGNVLGDNAGGVGGNDIIRIFPSGVVVGSVCGRNFCNQNAGDSITFLDEDASPALESADTIIVAGKVLGNVIAGVTYGNSDDTVIVVEGAEIGGTVYAGDETDGDSFIYIENIINEEKTISEVVNSVQEQDGKVTVNGVTYTLNDVEVVSGAVGQIACFGIDYRMNKASDGCSARSQSEKDAIQWHLNNPGNDGRLPGLESCAVYAYGNALRVYEIMDGAAGQLVAEIWGDVLSDAPASNKLLGATAEGNIALYHLASGELQVECRNLVDGKTQVRVLSDLAGTVTNAYDKS